LLQYRLQLISFFSGVALALVNREGSVMETVIMLILAGVFAVLVLLSLTRFGRGIFGRMQSTLRGSRSDYHGVKSRGAMEELQYFHEDEIRENTSPGDLGVREEQDGDKV
jgi:hypothetical protein